MEVYIIKLIYMERKRKKLLSKAYYTMCENHLPSPKAYSNKIMGNITGR